MDPPHSSAYITAFGWQMGSLMIVTESLLIVYQSFRVIKIVESSTLHRRLDLVDPISLDSKNSGSPIYENHWE